MLSFGRENNTGRVSARPARIPYNKLIGSTAVVDYNAPFFTTPASNYKEYPNKATCVSNRTVQSNPGQLTFTNREGQQFVLNDYDYAVLDSGYGNNPVVMLTVKDPNVHIKRSDTWFLNR